VITDLLLFFLGFLMYLGVGWLYGSACGICGGTPKFRTAAAGEGRLH
jgi:hypothetical protein